MSKTKIFLLQLLYSIMLLFFFHLVSQKFVHASSIPCVPYSHCSVHAPTNQLYAVSFNTKHGIHVTLNVEVCKVKLYRCFVKVWYFQCPDKTYEEVICFEILLSPAVCELWQWYQWGQQDSPSCYEHFVSVVLSSYAFH